MNAAIYVRVSTSGQETEGTSLDTQEAACRAYAAEHGYTVDERHVYRDIHTGAELWERPRLSVLREAVRDEPLDAVIVYALDRLSRKQAHVAIIADECERSGTSLLFVTEEFEQSAVGEFIRSAKAFAAELEREKIKERTHRGMMARLASGKPRVGPRPLYGYRWHDAEKSGLLPDPTTSPTVRRIFSEIAAGRTLHAIAKALNAEGIPSPTGRTIWRHGALRHMVLHPGYTGDVPTTPVLIDPATAQTARAAMARNQALAVRNNHSPESFLLRSGFIYCGYCGNAISASWEKGSTKRGSLFPIYHAVPGASGLGTHAHCPNPSIRATVLDAAVWERVEGLLTDPAVIAAEVARLAQSDPTGDDLGTVDRLLAEASKQQGNIANAIALLDDPDATAPLVAQLKALAERKRQLDQERAALVARHDAGQLARAQFLSLQQWSQTVATNLAETTYEQKRLILSMLGVRVTLYLASHKPRWQIDAAIPLDRAKSMPIADRSASACGGSAWRGRGRPACRA